jgi:hypothetical protein
MGAWYWIGVSAGLGGAAGILVAAVIARAAAVVGAFAGAGIGYLIEAWQSGGWVAIAVGAGGGLLAGYGAGVIVRGALRRGGTRGGTAILVAGAALVAAGLAFVPVVGYLEPIVIAAFAARLRRAQPERYAGLRTLAK